MNQYKLGISFTLLLLLCTACSQKQSLNWIPFNWEGDTISGRYIEKAFIYIPLKIEDLPCDFTMQLDLGVDQTLFYGNAIQPYLEECASLSEKYEIPMFKNINLHMGPVDFKGINIGYYNNFGEKIPKDSLYSKTPKHIGTIASDMFRDKVLVIDYKSARFAVADSLPAEYKDLPAEKFELKDGIMLLPFQIDSKPCKLMFDTGSSPFQLVTSKERALEISNSVITDSLSGPLWWGKPITFYGLEVNKPVQFGEEVLKKGKVYYDKDRLWEEVYNSFNIWGITGNAYFFDNLVIIDYKNKLFRVK